MAAKHVHRFFVSRPLGSGDTAFLDSDDSFHAARVLRLAPGEEVELVDPEGRIFMANVTRVGEKVQALAEYEVFTEDEPVSLTVVQALAGGRKMDYIVEKLSELGVERLIPAFTDKAVVRSFRTSADKVGRWRRIARAAASQSKRRTPMTVQEPVVLLEWASNFDGLILVLAINMDAKMLGEIIDPECPSLALVIGPEAGFSEDEFENLKKAGADFASLGRQVLRMETAAVVAAALTMHRLGVLG